MRWRMSTTRSPGRCGWSASRWSSPRPGRLSAGRRRWRGSTPRRSSAGWGTRTRRCGDSAISASSEQREVITMDATVLRVETEPDPRFVHLLEERLGDFNARVTGVADGEWLAIFVRDAGGELAAGLHGWTWGGCLYIRTLWVREDHRRRGLGRRLMEAAESEARRRGCRRAILETLEFQAPQFYARLGYRVTDELEGYPHAETRLIRLKKPLTAGGAGSR